MANVGLISRKMNLANYSLMYMVVEIVSKLLCALLNGRLGCNL